MSTTVTKQSVAFLVPGDANMPESDILADSGIAQAAAASLGQDVLVSYQQYYNFTGGINTFHEAFILEFLVTPAVALNIIAGIPALQTRIQAIAPQISRVVTWGTTVVFG